MGKIVLKRGLSKTMSLFPVKFIPLNLISQLNIDFSKIISPFNKGGIQTVEPNLTPKHDFIFSLRFLPFLSEKF